MQKHFNGGSPGNGAKVLSIYRFTIWPAVGRPELQIHSNPKAAIHMDGFRSANWKGRSHLWANDGPSVRVENKPLNELASNKARQESPLRDRAMPSSRSLLSAFLLAEGCPQGQVLMRMRLSEMGGA